MTNTKLSAVYIQVRDQLMGEVNPDLVIPVASNGTTTPGKSDAKSFDDWEEMDDSYTNCKWY